MDATSPPDGQSVDFLTHLWGTKPQSGAVQLWEKHNKTTTTFDSLGAAAEFARVRAQHGDLYMAAGLAAATTKPSPRRAIAAKVAGIAGVWADIDVNGGPQNKTGAAPSMSAAIELAGSILEPTLLVNSGYGLQAWWLLEDVWAFTMAAEREQAQRIVAGFQAALRTKAREAGFGIDSTFDLARLMRLPGTLNHKDPEKPAIVALLDHDGPRYDTDVLADIAAAHTAATANLVATLTGQGIEIVLNGTQPPFRIVEVLQEDPDFDVVWNHRQSKKTEHWTASEYDLSIANTLVKAGFEDQEIADCLRYHRRKFYADSDKGDRLDYLKRTIGKARGGAEHQQLLREQQYEREDAIDQLTEMAGPGGDDIPSETKIRTFTKAIGGPAIRELVQEGRDPDNSRFKLILDAHDDSGMDVEVPLGSVDGLISQEKFRQRFAVVTGHLPNRVKGTKWDEIVRVMLKAATVNEEAEDTRAAKATTWVERYCERRISTDMNAACEALDPWVRDGFVYVPLGPLRQYLAKILAERIPEIDLKLMLKAAGFQRVTVGYIRNDGKKSTRSYFRGSAALLDSEMLNDSEAEVVS